MLSLNRPALRPTNNVLGSNSRIELNFRRPPAPLGVIDEIEEDESDESHSLFEVNDEESNGVRSN